MAVAVQNVGRTVSQFVARYGTKLAQAGITDAATISRLAVADRVMTLTGTSAKSHSLQHLLNFVNRTGDAELKLITEFRASVKAGEVTAERFPLATKNLGYIHQMLTNAKVSSKQAISEIIASTDAHSGMHKLAIQIQKASETTGKTFLRQDLAGSLTASDHDVAIRFAQALKSDASWNNPFTAKQWLQLANQFKALPGVPQSAMRVLRETEQAAKPHLEAMERTMQPGAISRFFGGKPHVVVDEAAAKEVAEIYHRAFHTIAVTPKTEAVEAIATQKDNLLKRLLDVKINDSGAWRVYSSETWQNATQNGRFALSGTISESSATVKRGLLGRKVFTDTEGVISETGVLNGSTSLKQSVNLPIGETGVHAPQLSPASVMKQEGDVILQTENRLHTVSRTDHETWFKLAERELRPFGN